MAPNRGRGGYRGRGSSRGRGRSRGGSNAGRTQKRGFAPAKVLEPDNEALSESGSNTSDTDSLSNADSASDREEEAQPISNAYQTLLQSYQKANASKAKPPRKRAKTHHVSYEREDQSHDDHDNELDRTDEDEQLPDQEDAQPAHAEVEEPEDDAEENGTDPFTVHFANPDENELSKRLAAISGNTWTTERLNVTGGGKCLLQTPGENHNARPTRKVASTSVLDLKPRLVANAQQVLGDFDGLEQAIAPSVYGYQDVLFGGRTTRNASRLRHITCLHALNHIFKTRDRVVKNNAKLASNTEQDDVEYRDQGFTRPKVLFLLETKQACARMVDAITQLCDFDQQENKKRFIDSFSVPEDKFSDDKPEDFRELFEGNDENEFRIGLKFTRKTMKLYSKFYTSDIIFASPLGLRRAIESGDAKKQDYDFLSSIEIVIMDQADATLMQNWEHAEYVFEHLNLQPKDAHGCDFSRVRSWYLDGHAANLRQTIVLSAYLTPTINTLYNKHMRNTAGRLKYAPDYTDGTIETLNFGIKQTFSRFDSPTHIKDPDARFKYFSTAVLPQITRLPKPPEGGLGVLLFIPSYLDFVRVRNSLVDIDISYASISEYTDATDVRKARSHFMSGRHSLLLYTGRAHHFHRYNIRGVKRVVFYGVPENAKFYEEVVGFIGKSVERAEVSEREASVRVAFSRWESLELERVVGSKRVRKMVGERGDTFDFV
ncbi:U3 small nucleolar RNA-associated protein 25 [Lophiostoma macrostomum CBS 122681]|uniref:U3 small nucleolar RNA-associated protein 25 n=1 Tax=Lophiostoma macrostomum CBS 122681 TaxID=1314788 RepID=A0A6A6TQM9_9PLEO|nr:U3 small nucleolar RNA-associated protein 25 [Lophiostoma macrostomum CBS 122681]